MPSTFQFEIDSLSDQAKATYFDELDCLHNSYGPPPQDHRCHGVREHHLRYNYEDADRFLAYTKALDLKYEEPSHPGPTRGTEVDTVQGHYGIYRIVDSVANARIAQACHPGLRAMEFVEFPISDQLYFGDLVAVKTLAFNPDYFPRPPGSSVLPYHDGNQTLPGDHCRYSAREYLVFRRDIRRSQEITRLDERVGVIDGFSGLVRVPPKVRTEHVSVGDIFYPQHLDIRGVQTILTALPTILKYWPSGNGISDSLESLINSADLRTTRFDHRLIQRRGSICRDHLTIYYPLDWLEGSRVLVKFPDKEIEAELVSNIRGTVKFRLLERYQGTLMVPVMVQQLGYQGEPRRDRSQSRERCPSGERYPHPDRDQDSPSFEERYGRDEDRRSPRESREGDWGAQDQLERQRDSQQYPNGSSPRGSRLGYRPRSGNWDACNDPAGGQWDSRSQQHPAGDHQDSRYSRQGHRPRSPDGNWDNHPPRDPRKQGYRPRSPDPHWDHNDSPRQCNDSPKDYQSRDHFNHSQESFGPQFCHSSSGQHGTSGYSTVNDFQYPPRQPEHPNSQSSAQNTQSYRTDYPTSQPEQYAPQNRPLYRNPPSAFANDSRYPLGDQPQQLHNAFCYPDQSQDRPSCVNDRQQPSGPSGDHHYYRNLSDDRQYPSDQPGSQFSPQNPQYPSGHSQNHFETPILSQNRPIYRNPVEDHQYASQHHRNQSDTDRQTVPRSLSPRVSNLSSSEDNIRHSQSRSSISRSSSVSGGQSKAEQLYQRPANKGSRGPTVRKPSRLSGGPSQDEQSYQKPRYDGSSTLGASNGPFQDHQGTSSRMFEAPNARYPPSFSGGPSQDPQPTQTPGYNAPTDYPVRNSLSYHGRQSQDVPATSHQGYATSSGDSESDSASSSSDNESEGPQEDQNQGYNALRSYFPSSSGQGDSNRREPSRSAQKGYPKGTQNPSTSANPRELHYPSQLVSISPPTPSTPPKPAFQRPSHPVQDQTGSRVIHLPSQPDQCDSKHREPINRDRSDSQRPNQDQWESRPSGSSSRALSDGRTSQASYQSAKDSWPVRDHQDHEPKHPENRNQNASQVSDRPSQPVADHRGSHASYHPVKDHLDYKPMQPANQDPRRSQASYRPSCPVEANRDRKREDQRGSQASYHSAKDQWATEPKESSSQASTDHKYSQAFHQPANPKWSSKHENPDPEEDQHSENHIYNAAIPETCCQAADPPEDHPYLPALLENQVLVIDAPSSQDSEAHIASAAISLAKTDWNLKTRGLKQRGTQVIVCKPGFDGSRLAELLQEALNAPMASGLSLMRFTSEDTLRIDFDRCLARKLRGILRKPDSWDQRTVLQAAIHLTHEPLSPKIENLLHSNSHIPGRSMDEWTGWYMERWAPDIVLSTAEYLEEATRCLRKVESVQVLGAAPRDLAARFPGAKIAAIGDVLGGSLHPALVEILKESFSGMRAPKLLSLRPKAVEAPEVPNHYLKLRPFIFPAPNFPILLIHNTSTQGTKKEKNTRELEILDNLVQGIIDLKHKFSEQPIPVGDLQIICIEKNQVSKLRAIKTRGIRIRSRQEASEVVFTPPEPIPELRDPQEDHYDPQTTPQTTPLAIICCSNYKKSAFELIRDQLPRLLSYGTQATVIIGNIDEMEQAEGWNALVTRCEEVRCSYSYEMMPEKWIRKWYEPTRRDAKGYLGPAPVYGGSEGSSPEFWGSQSPKSRSSGSESPESEAGGSESPKSGSEEHEPFEPKHEPPEAEPEPSEAESKESEPLEPEPKPKKSKPEGPEPSKPELEEPRPSEPLEHDQKASEPELEEPKLSEPEPKVFEPKSEPEPQGPEKPEPSEPWLEQPEFSETEPKQSEPKPEKIEPSEPKPENPEHEESELKETDPALKPFGLRTTNLAQNLANSRVSEPNPLTLEHLDFAITATISPELSPENRKRQNSIDSGAKTPEKDFITPDRQLLDLNFDDFKPSDQEYEDCHDSEGSEEFEDAQEAGNEDSRAEMFGNEHPENGSCEIRGSELEIQDSDAETYASAYSDHQMTTGLPTIEEMRTEESASHEKLEEKQTTSSCTIPSLFFLNFSCSIFRLSCVKCIISKYSIKAALLPNVLFFFLGFHKHNKLYKLL